MVRSDGSYGAVPTKLGSYDTSNARIKPTRGFAFTDGASSYPIKPTGHRDMNFANPQEVEQLRSSRKRR